MLYSTTLAEPVGERAVLRAAFAADEVAVLKETATRPLSIGGPTLA